MSDNLFQHLDPPDANALRIVHHHFDPVAVPNAARAIASSTSKSSPTVPWIDGLSELPPSRKPKAARNSFGPALSATAKCAGITRRKGHWDTSSTHVLTSCACGLKTSSDTSGETIRAGLLTARNVASHPSFHWNPFSKYSLRSLLTVEGLRKSASRTVFAHPARRFRGVSAWRTRSVGPAPGSEPPSPSRAPAILRRLRGSERTTPGGLWPMDTTASVTSSDFEGTW
mmetsp:Transcript_28129/g.68399  ORF Transcript_28129/g.68399 Transcript_28129/m.68399 type:complete len:228 (-) Transcript_28129:579-1262(-)